MIIMRNMYYFAIVIGFLLIGFMAFASGDYLTDFEADIYALPVFVANVSLQVPNYVYIGNVTVGEKQANPTSANKIYINNTGNVDIRITPLLHNSSEQIFSYLYFSTTTTGPYQRIGNFSFVITAPTTGGYRADYFYAKLDLTNYTGNLTGDLIAHRTKIRFDAAAQ